MKKLIATAVVTVALTTGLTIPAQAATPIPQNSRIMALGRVDQEVPLLGG